MDASARKDLSDEFHASKGDGPAPLTATQHAMIQQMGKSMKSGHNDREIREKFDMSPLQFGTKFNQLRDHPEAHETYPHIMGAWSTYLEQMKQGSTK
jgi:hypothetical protein